MTRVPSEGELAARQHGVVAYWQLPAAGMTRAMLRAKLANGVLLEMHPGVYGVGHCQLRIEGHWLAAVLAVGPGAVLSHREAAALHGIRSSNRSRTDVTSLRRIRTGRPGIEIHHTTSLDAQEVTTVNSIPVTTVARTLVDLAYVVARDSLAKALREAEYLRLIDMHEIEDSLRRTRHRPGPGHANLLEVLEEHRRQGTQLTRSILEDRFVRLADRFGLPRPATNFHIDGHEVDAVWPTHRLAVELDGYARHKDRHAFQHDREKGNAIVRAGYHLLRFTHDDVVRRAAHTAAQIHAFLTDA